MSPIRIHKVSPLLNLKRVQSTGCLNQVVFSKSQSGCTIETKSSRSQTRKSVARTDVKTSQNGTRLLTAKICTSLFAIHSENKTSP
ncbi:hypothetical protein CDAR_438601 [Caerostris darwini]|uniref:Uncharacterized protein n=1 Tax=Caerostris darwini TaxID=1538125 RepID=A0AAV4X3M6_9ARAC|nr:hypothetical protein CDAR_438601 [Caerostris darwini]